MIAPCTNCRRNRTKFDRIADHCAACWTATAEARAMRALLADVREHLRAEPPRVSLDAEARTLALLERINLILDGEAK